MSEDEKLARGPKAEADRRPEGGAEAGSRGRISVSRRAFLTKTAAISALAAVPVAAQAVNSQRGFAQASSQTSPGAAADTFLELLREPDAVAVYSTRQEPARRLTRDGSEWRGSGVTVETRVSRAENMPASGSELAITLSAPALPLQRVHLRWRMPVAEPLLVLGDAWERSYGDLGWRNLIPERVMPWYFASVDGTNGHACHAYGVKTGAGAMCFWQLDPEGVSLWLDTSNGGSGVELGSRTLAAATVVTRQGSAGEDPQDAIRAFCRQMCSAPSLAAPGPVYGFNDWYYAYGVSTAQSILADTDFLAKLTSGNAVRPFSVIDGGWEDNKSFPDMPGLAKEIRTRQARPGIWIRPLLAADNTNKRLLLPDARFGRLHERAKETALDPTIPEAKELALAKVKQVVGWGYEMVKHDFSTYDLLGQWGFEMGGEPTVAGWSLNDRSRTNAEVILDLYRGIRASAAPHTLIEGCNTVGHLGQGLFDMQRTGDDTSCNIWERTRRMGVNTLAFRLPQHGAFFVQDADCVGLTPAIAWGQNRQWLDVLAHSGTALFVSPGEGSRGAEQSAALRAAFGLAASGRAAARPADWLEESTPERWTQRGASAGDLRYHWCEPDGAWPFTV